MKERFDALISTKDSRGRSPLSEAKRLNDPVAREILVKAGAKDAPGEFLVEEDEVPEATEDEKKRVMEGIAELLRKN